MNRLIIHQAVLQCILFKINTINTEMLPPAINVKREMSDGFQKYSQPNAIIMHDTLLVSSTKSAQHAFQTQMRSPLLFIIPVDVGKLRYTGFLGRFSFFFFLMWLTQGQTELGIQPR